VDAGGHLGLSDVHQHHHRSQQQAAGVGHAFACNVRCAAVDGLEHGHMLADVGTASQAHRAGHFGGDVADDVAIQVAGHNDIETLGPRGQACRTDVDDVVLGLDLGVVNLDFVKHLMKQTIGHLHDVVFGHAGHFFAAMGAGVLEGIAHDLFATGPRDELEALKHLVSLAVLDACVQVFLVFTDDHQVHGRVQGFDVRVVAHAGADVGVQAQGFADGDVQAFVTTTLRGGDGCFQKHLGAPQAVPACWCNASGVARQVNLFADLDGFGCDARASRCQYLQGRIHDFGADAVTVRHRDGHSQ